MPLGPPQRAVVIDNGTGYTKVGYAGNLAPDCVFPTAIASADEGSSDISATGREGLRDLDFSIGAEVRTRARARRAGAGASADPSAPPPPCRRSRARATA